MDFVTSKDGTAIAFERSGQGPPLVVVHGTTADHRRWRPILPDLERHFCVYAMDRRGRGSSGDAEDYAINREYEDVAAVVEVAGEQVRLLGHSFGALCALEAAFRTTRLHQLVLYEPVFPVDGAEVYPPHARRKFTALLESGDREGLLTAFLKGLGGVPGAWVTRAGQAEHGVLLYLHGGGFVIGSLSGYRHLVARLGAAAGLRAYFVDYRLAPEHPCPAAPDDALAAYRALLEAGHDPARIALAGDSAGGNLAAALSHATRGLDRPPVGQVLIYPGLGGEALGLLSYDEQADAPLLGTADVLYYKRIRAGGKPPAPHLVRGVLLGWQ